MIEKRFYKTISDIGGNRIYDKDKENAYFISCDEYTVDGLMKLLNELHEENTRLKNKLKFFNELNKPYGIMIGENKRLKSFIKQLTNNRGEIILMDGRGYRVDKILNDSND